jgi:hypothetical protein
MYRGIPYEMRPEYFDHIAESFFTRVPTRPLNATLEEALSTVR